MTWTERPSDWGKPGHVNSGDEYEEVLDQIAALTGTSWTAYTPTFSSTGTPATIGNGTIAGAYRWADESDMIIATGRLTWGSTTSAGTGNFTITVPTNASTNSQNYVQGTSYILDSGTQARIAICDFQAAGAIQFETASGGVTGTSPQTWATNDQLRWWICYEPA